ncbi:MAG: PTS sugar transporter subunit IIA [Ignavibacteriales bacterium]|nr:PTS system fructose-specific EIIABC component [Ignavibacteriaceae bacterium]MCK6614466.1 PTS sugar transporter subunit IIA [Ignavibacteriaceae bacterium]QOJ29795.1 MAG: PTS sugar transporter subunit IIA [Ignavibacteriales bacterium]
MKISELLTPELITTDLPVSDKNQVIEAMLKLIEHDPRVLDFQKVKQSVFDREKVMSTGVGKNFAIPHGKTDGISDIIIAFGKSDNPINYSSLDGQPVYLVLLMIGRENSVSFNIKILSRISRMMSNDQFREKLRLAESAAEIRGIFAEEESKYFDL